MMGIFNKENMTHIIISAVLLIFSLNIYTQAADIPVFLLTKENNTLAIEKVMIADGQTQAFITGNGSDIITVILPVSAGLSGDFSKGTESRVITARNKEGKLIISLQKADGTLKELLSKTADELKKYEIKVNITGLNAKKVFVISKYDTVNEDNNSPVIDMFQGKIPMSEGDFSITTEITEKEESLKLEGEFDVEYSGGYYFTKLKLNNRIVDAVIDLGAAQSFLIKDAVPEGVEIYKAYATEVSAEGNKSVELPVMGFGGEIKGLNACDIESARLGNIDLGKFTFNVMDSLRTTQSKKIEAIIGLDIISKAECFTMNIPAESETANAYLGKNKISKDTKLILQFNISQGHIFVNGKAGNTNIDLILDTGSPFNFLPLSLAETENIKLAESINVHGADGNKIKTYSAKVERLYLNNIEFKDIDFRFSDSPLFEKFSPGTLAGLLGTEFWGQFKTLQIDFVSKTIFLN